LAGPANGKTRAVLQGTRTDSDLGTVAGMENLNQKAKRKTDGKKGAGQNEKRLLQTAPFLTVPAEGKKPMVSKGGKKNQLGRGEWIDLKI